MALTRITVSFDPTLARAVRKAAGERSVSAWLVDAARQRLRTHGLLGVVREWEVEHGAITEAERRVAAREFRRTRRR